MSLQSSETICCRVHLGCWWNLEQRDAVVWRMELLPWTAGSGWSSKSHPVPLCHLKSICSVPTLLTALMHFSEGLLSPSLGTANRKAKLTCEHTFKSQHTIDKHRFRSPQSFFTSTQVQVFANGWYIQIIKMHSVIFMNHDWGYVVF
jgi:hypothetical protein